MNNYFFGDPFLEDYYAQLHDRRKAHVEGLRSQITPEMVNQTARVADAYPSLDKAVVAASGFVPGADANNDVWAQLAIRAENQRNQDRLNATEDDGTAIGGATFGALGDIVGGVGERVVGATRNTLRTAFTVFDTLWQEGPSRLFKTALATLGRTDDGVMSPVEAWKRAGTSTGVLAIQEFFGRRPVNLGSGFLPQSDPDTPGKQITELSREARETGLTRGGRPISPGRFVADQFWFEPGTAPYTVLSGALDGAAQIWLDPAAGGLKAASAYRKAQKVFSHSGEVSATVDAARSVGSATRRGAGLIDRIARKTIHGPTAESFLAGRQGRHFTRYLDTQIGADNIGEAVTVLEKHQRGFGREFFRRVADSDGPAEDVIRGMINEGLIETVPTPGSLGHALGGLVGGDFGKVAGVRAGLRRSLIKDTGWDRIFRQMPGKKLNIEDLDEGFWTLNETLVAAGFDEARRSEYLYRWSQFTDEGSREGAYQLMIDVADEFGTNINRLWANAVKGMSKKSAKRIMSAIKTETKELSEVFNSYSEIRHYFDDIVGNAGFHPGAKMKTFDASGRVKVLPTAQLITEFLNRAIPLPDFRRMRNALSPSRRSLFRIAPKFFDGPFGKNSLQLYMLDPFMTAVWKPLQLIRVAWPMRVIPEEGARLSVEGLDSMFSNPLSAMAFMIHNPDRNLITRFVAKTSGGTRGATGVLGNELRMAQEWVAATSTRMGDLFLGMTDSPWTRQAWRSYSKGSDGFAGHWTRELLQLVDDELAPRVARNLDEAKVWLNGAEGRAMRERLATSGSQPFSVAILNDDAAMALYAESVHARVYGKAGGTVRLKFNYGDDANPQWVTETGADLPAEFAEAVKNNEWNRIGYDYEGGASPDIDVMEMIATGHIEIDGNMVDLRNLTPETHEQVKTLLGTDRFNNIAPDVVKGAVPFDASKIGSGDAWRRVLDIQFQRFMSTPTATLSRSPAFRQFYWRRVEQLLGFTDEGSRRAILTQAREANLPNRTLRSLKAKIDELDAAGIRGDILDVLSDVGDEVLESALVDIDNLAKASALDHTKALLYDTSRRNNISDMYRNMAPFGEAWLEIITTWSKLMYENPQVFRRGQQGIEGARGSGFFQTDPETGEEMFNYPGGEFLTRMLFGDAADALGPQGQLKLQGRVQGLNLVGGSVLPGFGPALQIPASHLLQATKYDGIRKILLPFGDQSIRTGPGDVINDALPSYLSKILIGLSGLGTSDAQRILGNSAMDVYKTLVMQGRDDTTPQQRDALMKDATQIAQRLILIRGIAQSFLPTGPEAKFYIVPDTNRDVIGDERADQIEAQTWLYTSLGSAWRELQLKHDGDDVAAQKEFTAMFGIDPASFATYKTVQIAQRSTQIEGDKWARDHPELFDVAPFTAYFAHPDDPTSEEFDFNAYNRSLQDGARESLTLEQWVLRRNDFLGRIRYERGRQEADERFGTKSTRQKVKFLQAWRQFLMGQHFGYRMPNPGVGQTPNIETKIRELTEVWSEYGLLRNSDTGVALQKYLLARRRVIEQAEAMGLSRDGWHQANRAQGLREVLRQYAALLIEQHEDFAILYQLVLSHEFDDDLGEATANLALGGQ